jgi:hypothetical protein
MCLRSQCCYLATNSEQNYCGWLVPPKTTSAIIGINEIAEIR